jgi:hypothetical protein
LRAGLAEIARLAAEKAAVAAAGDDDVVEL